MWKMECVSTPRVTPRFLLTEILISFCGRVFGGLRSPQKWPSSGKIHTEDNPQKRYICIVKWCCMCKNTGDSKINGSFAAILHIIYGHWCFACSDSIGLRQRRVLNLLACWKRGFGRHPNADLWEVTHHMDYLERGICILLKGLNIHLWSWNCFWYVLCMIGQLLRVVTLSLIWRNFQICVTSDDVCNIPSTQPLYMGNMNFFIFNEFFNYLYKKL